MSDGSGCVLRAIGVDRHFDDGQRIIHVLRGLELSVGERESIAVVGESGVGKSTLLHILGALDRPDGGDVELDGKSLFSMSPADLAKVRCRSLGFVCHSRSELDAWHRKIQDAGVVESGVVESPFGWHVNFRDPDGIPLEFFLPRADVA